MDSALESAVELSVKFIPDRQLPDKAIDLMDEALSAVKMKSISKPMEVEVLEKKLRTLEIEYEAKKAEKDTKKEVLEKLEKDIASTKEQTQVLVSAWKKERDLIIEIKNLREKIDRLRIEAEDFERQGNFGEVARVRY